MKGSTTEEGLRRLMVSSQSGDAQAYQALLRALSGHLRGFFRRRLSRLPDEVEDLVQETLLAIHNQRHTYDPLQPLTAWIHAIARYKLVDMLRRHGQRAALTDPLDDVMDLLAASSDEALEARRDLMQLLALLPDKQRLPILHVKIEGLSVAETAALTGLSEPAVKIGVHRGLKALAARIRGDA